MIKLELSPDTKWNEVSIHLGTVHHNYNNIGVSINQDFKSTLATRRYMGGLEPPNYPMPAIRDVKTWDLWLLYRPYPASYLIELR